METQVVVNKFYPEEFRQKADSEKYLSKGTCEVHLLLGAIEMDRIDHEGKILLKPPFRIHSNKKAGIKPRLVPLDPSPCQLNIYKCRFDCATLLDGGEITHILQVST
jgi:hypothetical protein